MARLTTIDLGFQGFTEIIGAFVAATGNGRYALFESGPASTVDAVERCVTKLGFSINGLDAIFATHVHLDHAGGAGLLMQELPNARCVVHRYGARHMIDPSRLEASVRQVYGDETYDREYGALVPVPEQRVRAVEDGERLRLGDRELLFRDTPGHARHHFCVWDEKTAGWFTGDTFMQRAEELIREARDYILIDSFLIVDDEKTERIFELLMQKMAMVSTNKHLVVSADYINRITKPEATVAVTWAGVLPYFLNRPVVDRPVQK